MHYIIVNTYNLFLIAVCSSNIAGNRTLLHPEVVILDVCIERNYEAFKGNALFLCFTSKLQNIGVCQVYLYITDSPNCKEAYYCTVDFV